MSEEKYYGHKLIGADDQPWYGHIYSSREIVKMAGSGEIIELKIRACNEGEESKYYGWYDNEKKKYLMIYPGLNMVQMCSPDYFEAATERGEGQIVNVVVEEV